MKGAKANKRSIQLLLVGLFLGSSLGAISESSLTKCLADGDIKYICGPIDAEDFLETDGTPWVLSTGIRGDLYAINSKTRDWHVLGISYPKRPAQRVRHRCPSLPDRVEYQNHGVHVRLNRGRHHEFYVVNHSDRESIEIYDIDLSESVPRLIWKDCLIMPGTARANSVVPLKGGGVIATVFADMSISIPERIEMLTAGESTGYVIEWQPDTGWRRLANSELSGNNGIEISPDGRYLYVGSWGTGTLFRYTLDHGNNITEQTKLKLPMDLVDNLRWTRRGTLLMAGHAGPVASNGACLVAPDPVCQQDYGYSEIDVETMTIVKSFQHKGTPAFGSATTAIEIDDEIWLGTYRGNRIARIPIK